MQIQRDKIDAAARVVQDAEAKLKEARSAFTAEVLAEAHRIVAEHDARIVALRQAEATYDRVTAELDSLRKQDEDCFGRYQRASYADSRSAVAAARKRGKEIKTRLVAAIKTQEEAAKYLQTEGFDEQAHDEALRFPLAELRPLVEHDQHARQILDKLGEPARDRVARRRDAMAEAERAEHNREVIAKRVVARGD